MEDEVSVGDGMLAVPADAMEGSGERAGRSFGPYIRGLCKVLGPLEKQLLETRMARVKVLPPVYTYRAPSVLPPDLQVTQPSLPEDCSLAE